MTDILISRWIRHHKLYFLTGSIIVIIQIILAYKSLGLPFFNESSKLMSSNSNKKKHSILDNQSTSFKDVQQKKIIDLNITLPCQHLSNEAISAINRAHSNECKLLIANISCAVTEKIFYKDWLPNYCPSGNFTKNRAIGCYMDDKNSRLLTGYYIKFKNNSQDKCVYLCLQSGYIYAGLQYS